MPKFILIDHSIVDLSGHYYEYAVRVLGAAEKAGYRPVLATNRKLEIRQAVPWETHPVYEHGFFRPVRGWTMLTRLKSAWRRWHEFFLIGVLYSFVGLVWTNRLNLGGMVQQIAAVYPPRRPRSWLVYATVIGILAVAAALGFVVSALALRRLGRMVLKVMRRVFGRGWDVLRRMALQAASVVKLYAARKHYREFSRDTALLFRRIALETGDLVFIPTLSESDLMGVLDYFHREACSTKATWHFVFRRNIYVGREPDYAAQEEGQRQRRNTFRHFQRGLCGQQVFFYTDTKQLTDQYERLGAGPFQTLPIPVRWPDTGAAAAHQGDGPLEVIYLGDARSEKGYQYLPRTVQDLWADEVASGRMRFAIQSNYNIPSGEAAAVVARGQLEAFPADQVRLAVEAMSSEEYRHFVLGGQIALIPYDRDNYYARSSGTFAEVMAAGIPVVVPPGTWMACQLAARIYQYHLGLDESPDVTGRCSCRPLAWTIHGEQQLPWQSNGGLDLCGKEPRCCTVTMPPGFTHLRLRLRIADDAAGHFVRIQADQLDLSCHRLSRLVHVAGGSSDGWTSVLLPLDGFTRQVSLQLRGAFSEQGFHLDDLQADLLTAAAGLPLSAVGVMVADPLELSAAIREIARWYPHYRATAADFATGWSRYHDPQQLVANLRADSLAAMQTTGDACGKDCLEPRLAAVVIKEVNALSPLRRAG